MGKLHPSMRLGDLNGDEMVFLVLKGISLLQINCNRCLEVEDSCADRSLARLWVGRDGRGPLEIKRTYLLLSICLNNLNSHCFHAIGHQPSFTRKTEGPINRDRQIEVDPSSLRCSASTAEQHCSGSRFGSTLVGPTGYEQR